ncbi:hypothetical protein BC938DRAFT_473832 [Jimgerdemannia flammicorona]|uniref:Uncharacterized protein n=1 Tax=Jimgerdemannia flammicorona TaxID=994334 RepID=A0A433QSZ9_9FUNG|nr:hypothetical protein BC938DRAFT_473832 [Jimgerdemannia flammicorona]
MHLHSGLWYEYQASEIRRFRNSFRICFGIKLDPNASKMRREQDLAAQFPNSHFTGVHCDEYVLPNRCVLDSILIRRMHRTSTGFPAFNNSHKRRLRDGRRDRTPAYLDNIFDLIYI